MRIKTKIYICDLIKDIRSPAILLVFWKSVAAINFEMVKLKINYSVYETDTKQQLAKGYTVHAFVNERNVPSRIPKQVLAKMKMKFKWTYN